MSLFGTPQPAQRRASVFGSLSINTGASQPPQPTSNLFGTSTAPSQQPPQINPLQQTNNQPQGLSLFGASTQPQQGVTGPNPVNQPQQQQPGTGLFSRPALTTQQPLQQQQQQPSFAATTFAASQSHQQPQARSTIAPLWQPTSSISPREKSVPEQMQVILEKWSPDSANCSFQQFFYNSVNPDAVPYYGPAPGEDESKWEEALKNKPVEGSIPVLCRGFAALGNRLRIQVQSVMALQSRLHEINNSLTSMLQTHDLDLSVRTMDAKRRHLALSQRCIQLATKAQILQNRGYGMDGAEEELTKKIVELEKGVFDPQLSGRQEEIWARMVGIRERMRFLQEEAEKTGAKMAATPENAIDEEVIKSTKKLLADYDTQLRYLRNDLEDIRKEFGSWEGSNGGE